MHFVDRQASAACFRSNERSLEEQQKRAMGRPLLYGEPVGFIVDDPKLPALFDYNSYLAEVSLAKLQSAFFEPVRRLLNYNWFLEPTNVEKQRLAFDARRYSDREAVLSGRLERDPATQWGLVGEPYYASVPNVGPWGQREHLHLEHGFSSAGQGYASSLLLFTNDLALKGDPNSSTHLERHLWACCRQPHSSRGCWRGPFLDAASYDYEARGERGRVANLSQQLSNPPQKATLFLYDPDDTTEQQEARNLEMAAAKRRQDWVKVLRIEQVQNARLGGRLQVPWPIKNAALQEVAKRYLFNNSYRGRQVTGERQEQILSWLQHDLHRLRHTSSKLLEPEPVLEFWYASTESAATYDDATLRRFARLYDAIASKEEGEPYESGSLVANVQDDILDVEELEQEVEEGEQKLVDAEKIVAETQEEARELARQAEALRVQGQQASTTSTLAAKTADAAKLVASTAKGLATKAFNLFSRTSTNPEATDEEKAEAQRKADEAKRAADVKQKEATRLAQDAEQQKEKAAALAAATKKVNEEKAAALKKVKEEQEVAKRRQDELDRKKAELEKEAKNLNTEREALLTSLEQKARNLRKQQEEALTTLQIKLVRERDYLSLTFTNLEFELVPRQISTILSELENAKHIDTDTASKFKARTKTLTDAFTAAKITATTEFASITNNELGYREKLNIAITEDTVIASAELLKGLSNDITSLSQRQLDVQAAFETAVKAYKDGMLELLGKLNVYNNTHNKDPKATTSIVDASKTLQQLPPPPSSSDDKATIESLETLKNVRDVTALIYEAARKALDYQTSGVGALYYRGLFDTAYTKARDDIIKVYGAESKNLSGWDFTTEKPTKKETERLSRRVLEFETSKNRAATAYNRAMEKANSQQINSTTALATVVIAAANASTGPERPALEKAAALVVATATSVPISQAQNKAAAEAVTDVEETDDVEDETEADARNNASIAKDERFTMPSGSLQETVASILRQLTELDQEGEGLLEPKGDAWFIDGKTITYDQFRVSMDEFGLDTVSAGKGESRPSKTVLNFYIRPAATNRPERAERASIIEISFEEAANKKNKTDKRDALIASFYVLMDWAKWYKANLAAPVLQVKLASAQDKSDEASNRLQNVTGQRLPAQEPAQSGGSGKAIASAQKTVAAAAELKDAKATTGLARLAVMAQPTALSFETAFMAMARQYIATKDEVMLTQIAVDPNATKTTVQAAINAISTFSPKLAVSDSSYEKTRKEATSIFTIQNNNLLLVRPTIKVTANGISRDKAPTASMSAANQMAAFTAWAVSLK
jgi:hypothetical protein